MDKKQKVFTVVMVLSIVFFLGSLCGILISMAYHNELKKELKEIVETERMRTTNEVYSLSKKLSDFTEQQEWFQKNLCYELGIDAIPKYVAKVSPTPSPIPTPTIPPSKAETVPIEGVYDEPYIDVTPIVNPVPMTYWDD